MVNDSLNIFLQMKLKEILDKNQLREIVSFKKSSKMNIIKNKKKYVSFSCNDYLGLSQDKLIKEEAVKAIRKYGVGAGASRLISGSHPLYKKLEKLLAYIKQTEDACVFGSGFLTNIGVIPSLVKHDDLVILDELCHASTHLGVKISRSNTEIYKHNNLNHLKRILKNKRETYRHCLILTEGVFSMDGDLSPQKELSEIAKYYNSWLMVDDAHGFGVIGDGCGSSARYDKRPEIHIQMGTLSKAVGSYGGFVCGSKNLVKFLINRSRSQIYTTGLPPSVVAASISALKRIINDKELTSKPLNNARLFSKILDIPEPESPIVPIVIGSEKKLISISRSLENKGFLVGAIRPPTVPDGTSRLRITFSATHTKKQIVSLAKNIKELSFRKSNE